MGITSAAVISRGRRVSLQHFDERLPFQQSVRQFPVFSARDEEVQRQPNAGMEGLLVAERDQRIDCGGAARGNRRSRSARQQPAWPARRRTHGRRSAPPRNRKVFGPVPRYHAPRGADDEPGGHQPALRSTIASTFRGVAPSAMRTPMAFVQEHTGPGANHRNSRANGE